MFGQFVTAIVALCGVANAGIGPQALYNLLNGQTFNPPGYTIVMYQSCMQNQNAGNPCGSFSTYQTSNGVYTQQLYGPAPAVSATCSRTFYLTLACGSTTSMSGVNENPTCVYSATLTLPQACGIDFTVGNEAASVSGTAVPATPSITRTITWSPTQTYTASETISQTGSATYTGTGTQSQTGTPSFTYTGTNTLTGTQTQTGTPSFTYTGTNTLTQSATPTNIYEFTLIPSKSVSPSVPPTTTPLFMITAWATPSPVNVSATSSPRFMMTAYPTNASGAGGAGGPSLLENLGVAPGSSTATILGGVAVGAIALAGVAYAIHHFRNGGTVKGLVEKVKANKDKIAGAIETVVPMTEEQKAKLHSVVNDPTSVLPANVQQVVKNAEQYKTQIISSLPISEAQKSQVTSVVNSVQTRVIHRVESAFEPTQDIVTVSENVPIQLELSSLDTTQPIVEVIHTTPEESSAGSPPQRSLSPHP
jgi:hypothetical protein